MTAAEYLVQLCPHCKNERFSAFRSQCKLCFEEVVVELLALRTEIDALRAEHDARQWISVTDRLPESGIPVLIVIDGTVYRGAHCAEGTVECDEDDDGAGHRAETDTYERSPGWYWCDGLAWTRLPTSGALVGLPTHWMALPLAPGKAEQ